jgi:hypothetical protein
MTQALLSTLLEDDAATLVQNPNNQSNFILPRASDAKHAVVGWNQSGDCARQILLL